MFGKKVAAYRTGSFGEKLLVFYLAGVLLGIILLQFPDKEFMYRFGFFSESIMERLRYMEVERKGLFFYCLKKRGCAAGLLAVFALTNLAPFVALAFIGWIGLETGAWITAAAVRYGIIGPVLYFGMIMPQILCYVPAFLLYVRWMQGIYYGEHRAFGKMAQLLAAFLLFLLGILMESFVNPILLKNFIKFFL